MATRILIIDDDEKLNKLLMEYLSQFGYQVIPATNPEDGLKMLRPIPPDIIILDIMLPGMDGFETCRKIRESYSIPIIMLTARGDVSDRIVGLEMGADDYLPKPFDPRELVARIQSVLRRSRPGTQKDIIRVGDLTLDLRSQQVELKGRDPGLTTMEFEVLALLARSPGRIFTRDEIIDASRGLDWDSYDRSIDVVMSRLRSKMEDDARNPLYIKTVRGKGYMYIQSDRDDA